MAERTDYEYGPITPVPEDQQEYFFDPDWQFYFCIPLLSGEEESDKYSCTLKLKFFIVFT